MCVFRIIVWKLFFSHMFMMIWRIELLNMFQIKLVQTQVNFIHLVIVCYIKCYTKGGVHGIDPTFLNLDWFVVAGGRLYFNYNLQSIKLDKERKNLWRKKSFMFTKNGFNPDLSSIPCLPRKVNHKINRNALSFLFFLSL